MLFVFALCCSYPLFAQVSWNHVPIHSVAPPRSYHEGFETPACIDTALWSSYLDWGLLLDSSKRKEIPEGIYKIRMQFAVDTGGKIVLVKALENPFELGDLVQKRITAFPYRWSPATRNGRTVKSYHRVMVVFDLRKTNH
ncbi:hypothetical protein [Niabella aurantiaca]|uniref:hypothetical protein n=1 Tax=Niabella aurantiaca TaxID=379900 RepID=UPI00035EAC5F|nr:hypothetical protein [Niabella aurantiaca]